MADKERKPAHDCVICAGALGSNGGILAQEREDSD
jgi:hypothetical protein